MAAIIMLQIKKDAGAGGHKFHGANCHKVCVCVCVYARAHLPLSVRMCVRVCVTPP